MIGLILLKLRLFLLLLPQQGLLVRRISSWSHPRLVLYILLHGPGEVDRLVDLPGVVTHVVHHRRMMRLVVVSSVPDVPPGDRDQGGEGGEVGLHLPGLPRHGGRAGQVQGRDWSTVVALLDLLDFLILESVNVLQSECFMYLG